MICCNLALGYINTTKSNLNEVNIRNVTIYLVASLSFNSTSYLILN